jgi:hypothetical protein
MITKSRIDRYIWESKIQVINEVSLLTSDESIRKLRLYLLSRFQTAKKCVLREIFPEIYLYDFLLFANHDSCIQR